MQSRLRAHSDNHARRKKSLKEFEDAKVLFAAPTVYDAGNVLVRVRQVLTADKLAMAKDLLCASMLFELTSSSHGIYLSILFWFLIRSLRCVRELEHLKTRLDDLMAPVRKEEWSDVLEAWMSLSDLRSRLRGQRCKAVLKIIFADEELCKAVGMLIQLRDIACPEDPAAGLIKALKTAQAFIKQHHYTFLEAIGGETAKIERILGLQARSQPPVASALRICDLR